MPTRSYDDQTKATKLLDKYGSEVDDFFKLWPPDKRYFFSSDSQAFIAYGLKSRVAVCLGDPVGPDKSIVLVLAEFKQLCKQNKWTMVFIQTVDKYNRLYADIGLKGLVVGSDAVIDLAVFNKTTIRSKYFRNLVNRYSKLEMKLDSYQPPHSKQLIAELQAISSSWTNLPNRKEWSFLTGRFDDDYLQRVPLHVLRDKEGQAMAFVNELPIYKSGVATIDLMRRSAEAPTNVIDLLFIELLRQKQKDGLISFNLGMSPLDGKPFVKSRLERVVLRLYAISNKFIGFRGLHQFKAKYQPSWEPRYVWYQGPTLGLVKIGISILKLMRS